MKVKGILAGGQEAWKAADDLKKNNIPVIYTHIYSLPILQDQPYDYFYEAPSKMQAAGVKFCISTGDTGPEVRDLPYQAGSRGLWSVKGRCAQISHALPGRDPRRRRPDGLDRHGQDREHRRGRRRHARIREPTSSTSLSTVECYRSHAGTRGCLIALRTARAAR